MRIMLLTHSYWPESTPPQRRWMAFIRVFRDSGWDIDVVAPRPRAEESIREKLPAPRRTGSWQEQGPCGETIRRLPPLMGASSWGRRLAGQCVIAALSIPRAMLVPRPDIVVVTVPSLPHIVAGRLIATLCRRPLVVDMRDAWPDLAHDSQVADGRATAVLDFVMSRVQRSADLVVTVTDGFRRQLGSRGVHTAVTVHNGISADRLVDVAPRGQHGGPLRVLYMGNHGESQGLATVIHAAALAGSAVEVRFVGSGTVRSRLMQLSDELGAGVAFWAGIHGEDVAQHYEWADTCVVSLRADWPSFNWTVPSKTYELLSTGRHITAILRGEAAEIIEASGSGDVVVAEPEAIAALWSRLSENRELLAKNTAGPRWVAEHANIPDLARLYMGYLRSVAPGATTS